MSIEPMNDIREGQAHDLRHRAAAAVGRDRTDGHTGKAGSTEIMALILFGCRNGEVIWPGC